MEDQAGAEQPAAGPSRQADASDKAKQAQKLAQRLAAGDGVSRTRSCGIVVAFAHCMRFLPWQRLALLLTQMADALSSLVDKSQETVSQSAHGGEGEGEEVEPLPLSDYEDLLQDWLASVHVSWPS